MQEKLPTIFVSIASYRDPECQHTIAHLYAQAAHPERVFVGVCWQFDPKLDKECFEVPAPRPQQVRDVSYHTNDSKGCCWARAQALALHQNEDYILQIDAHMRFVPAWDRKMIDILKQSPGAKVVLSTMPPAYNPPDKYQDGGDDVSITFVKTLGKKDELQPISLGGFIRKKDKVGDKPHPGAFIIGNFLFAPARAFSDIPFDPHIFFRGQEPTYSARLWTNGWDIWQPHENVIYHYWASPGPKTGKKATYKESSDAAVLARQRVRHLLGVEPAQDARALKDIDAYGMGKVRSLRDYWEYAGVDLHTGKIATKAAQGRWTPYVPAVKGAASLDSLAGTSMVPRYGLDV